MEIKYLAGLGLTAPIAISSVTRRRGFGAVIDPGGSPDQILAVLEKLACRPCAILLTHGHYDHTGAVADLLERFPGIRVSIHRGTSRTWTQSSFPSPGQVPEEAVSFYDEGDTVTVGACRWRCSTTPATPRGGVTLRCGSALFCGDTLFAGSCGPDGL